VARALFKKGAPVDDVAFINLGEGATMSVAKVTEITSTSTKSFDDAISGGLARANKTLKNVTGAWVKDQKLDVKNGAISSYRVSMKVTFVLDD